MLTELAEELVELVHHFGYAGVFVMTFLESTFVPLPAEITMVPAGYLVQQGQWNFFIVWFLSIAGTVSGSVANYGLAHYLGRPFFYRYGKYVFFPAHRMEMLDKYFAAHGEISIFTGRLIPGVRHVISFPAGLAGMSLKRFTFLTALGGGLWMTILITTGYLIGGNKDLVKHYMPYITGASILAVIILVSVYVWRHRRKKGESDGI